NELNAALDDYQTCFNIDSTQGVIYYNRACLNLRMGNINAAIYDERKAEELQYRVPGKFKKALKEYNLKTIIPN
ncbi:MAG: hypothetical protein H0W84_07135, partial [Bacteroidetes bacterium]|nr:hypothetical protein [Bacteroidota bacterium]